MLKSRIGNGWQSDRVLDKRAEGAFSGIRCHYLRMQKNRFHDAQLIRTPGWPLFFALCAAVAIIIFMALKMAR